SVWAALSINLLFGDANIRGNQFESFGSVPTVLVDTVTQSCLFCENQCFLENPNTAALEGLVVRLGLSDRVNAGAIIASNNFVRGPAQFLTHNPGPVMNLNPKDAKKTLTVLGNITSGGIAVGSSLLASPWDQLNVIA